MKDILVLVAKGFEDTELISSINVFDREGISYELVATDSKGIIEGQNKRALLKVDKELSDIKTSDYKGVFIPGGIGHKSMLDNHDVINIIKSFEDKYIFAICAAPTVLLKAGVIKGQFTSFPGYAEDPRNTGNEIEISNKTITGRDFEATIKFAKEIANMLKKTA